MNRPTTRTEQMLASVSKGVSSRLMLAEAAGFVETGDLFLAELIQRLLRKAGEPQAFAAVTSKSMISSMFDCRRFASSPESIKSRCPVEFPG
jgi:hypothetical protein